MKETGRRQRGANILRWLTIAGGMALALVAVFADSLGLGAQGGFGLNQAALLGAGIGFMLIGYFRLWKILIATMSTAVTLLAILLILIFSRGSLQEKFWYEVNDAFATRANGIGIYQNDPSLGWTHIPNSQGQQISLPNFDVSYRINEKGFRFTEGEEGLPKVVFLGGSYTFGIGVEDNETYVSLLAQDFPQYKLVNASVSAWGTAQSYLKMQEMIANDDDIEIIVYGFIGHHTQRNYRRATWLNILDRQAERRLPYYEIVDGALVFQGLADPQKDGLAPSAELTQTEVQLTLMLIGEMKKLAEANDIEFIVVYLPNNPEFMPPQMGTEISSIVGEQHFYDLTEEINFLDYKFPFDEHPNAEGHRLIADHLAVIFGGN